MSGRTYETPVILAQVPEGFIAELSYGDKVDWYRNVIAADGCIVVHHRGEYCVKHIEIATPGRAARLTPPRSGKYSRPSVAMSSDFSELTPSRANNRDLRRPLREHPEGRTRYGG
jgi:hypothetical protein